MLHIWDCSSLTKFCKQHITAAMTHNTTGRVEHLELGLPTEEGDNPGHRWQPSFKKPKHGLWQLPYTTLQMERLFRPPENEVDHKGETSSSEGHCHCSFIFSGRQFNFPAGYSKSHAEVALVYAKCRINGNRKNIGKDTMKSRCWICFSCGTLERHLNSRNLSLFTCWRWQSISPTLLTSSCEYQVRKKMYVSALECFANFKVFCN